MKSKFVSISECSAIALKLLGLKTFSRTTQGNPFPLHDCRGRKRLKGSEQINDGTSTPAAGATEAMQVDDVIASILTLDCIDIDHVRTAII
ncbi:hypothetical protein EVAR_39265_1 [Eumeta japonica]|uniref:Uncharacterized protein n=1 Tax=Eumeta variegata TaxID=151549 RepID=A0A4C1VY80_EUMVA|nr:hypothetical protein EVAR_39265_1 [Eumeta japonica]